MRSNKWPNHNIEDNDNDNKDAEWRIPPFHEWYYSDHVVEDLKKFYTGTILKHWKETLGIQNILIYNLHEDTPSVRRCPTTTNLNKPKLIALYIVIIQHRILNCTELVDVNSSIKVIRAS